MRAEETHPYLICMTPTRNERWIVDRFLAACKMWADSIIVADQGSTDGTWEALNGKSGITPIINEADGYDERHRQNLLIGEARKVPGKRILIALDADEALSANCVESKEWDAIARAKPGTVLRFRWANVLPGFKEAWIPPTRTAFGFVDDGSEHHAKRIHSTRIPVPEGAPILDLDEIVVLHFQYVVWERMNSKRRWYQAWEHAHHRKKGPLQIFREYNHMVGRWKRDEIFPLRDEWLKGYEERGVNFRNLVSEPVTWWDKEVVQMLSAAGPKTFRKIAIWDKDWNEAAKALGLSEPDFGDPRSLVDKISHKLLAKTQQSRERLSVRGLEFLLRKLGW